MATREKKTPNWLIERLAAGELDSETANDVRRRLAAEGRSPDAEIATLERSNREILEAHPPAGIATEVRRRAIAEARKRARPRRTLMLGGALVAAGALALVLLPRPHTSDDDGWGDRIKGDLHVNVYRHGADGDQRLPDGALAARGDLVQLTYRTPAQAHGVLLSVDGAGVVTQHWPVPDAPRSALLRVGGEVRLPSSYELDDAPGFERFFLVAADRPFDVAPVLQAARTLGAHPRTARYAPLPLPPGFVQASVALDKPRPSSSKETP
jgi:hypothetical protein